MNTTHELIENHLPMVRKIALRLAAAGQVTPDKVEENIAAGYLGLVEAARNYRADAPDTASFATFAYLRIRGAMIDAIGKSCTYSRRTVHTMRQLYDENELRCSGGLESSSGSELLSNDCAENALYKKQILERIALAANKSLSLREQDVIRRHYFEDMSLTAIAGDSKKRSITCKAHRKALQKLKRILSGTLKEEA